MSKDDSQNPMKLLGQRYNPFEELSVKELIGEIEVGIKNGRNIKLKGFGMHETPFH